MPATRGQGPDARRFRSPTAGRPGYRRHQSCLQHGARGPTHVGLEVRHQVGLVTGDISHACNTGPGGDARRFRSLTSGRSGYRRRQPCLQHGARGPTHVGLEV